MKKILSLIVILLVFASCQEEVNIPTPGFQAYKDNVLFRGIDVKAYKSTSGAIRIVALAEGEEMEIRTSSSDIGSYYLGSTNANNVVQYTNNFDTESILYSSSSVSGPILNISNLVLAGGDDYTAGTSVATSATTGSGMKVNTTVNANGEITSVKIAVPGSGYKSGQVITVSGGNNKAKFKILSEVKITDNSNNTLTGSFKFNAKRFGNEELVNFQYGAFYQIPVIPEL